MGAAAALERFIGAHRIAQLRLDAKSQGTLFTPSTHRVKDVALLLLLLTHGPFHAQTPVGRSGRLQPLRLRLVPFELFAFAQQLLELLVDHVLLMR